MFTMAKCLNCTRDFTTPFFMNVEAWRWLACPYCGAKLEKRNPRYLVAAGPCLLVLIALGNLGHRYRVIAEVLLAVMLAVVLVVTVLELMRPQLQLRKTLAKPKIELKINDPSN